jgi:hypothetical protein
MVWRAYGHPPPPLPYGLACGCVSRHAETRARLGGGGRGGGGGGARLTEGWEWEAVVEQVAEFGWTRLDVRYVCACLRAGAGAGVQVCVYHLTSPRLDVG